MKQFKFRMWILLILMVILTAFSGCSNGGLKPSESSLTTIAENQSVTVQETETKKTESGQTADSAQSSPQTQAVTTTQSVAAEITTGITAATPTKEEKATTEVAQTQAQPSSAGPTLNIKGLVAENLSLDLQTLKGMSSYLVEADYFALNSFGTKAHFKFKGVSLWPLLSEVAKIQSTATQVTLVATDGYQMTFSLSQVQKQDYMDETDSSKKLPMIIAWEENGKPYDPEEGPPFKLVVGQIEPRDVNKPQWVSNIDSIIVE